MKVYDVISESKEVNEAPMGMFKKLGNKIASKIPGDIGASAQGKLNVGGEANRLKKDLARYMGGAGIKRGQLTPDQFVQFLDQVGLEGMKTMSTVSADRSADNIEPDAPMSKAEVDKYLLKATQSGFAGQGMKSNRSKFAAPGAGGPPPAPGTRPAGVPPPSAGGQPVDMNTVSAQDARLIAMLKSRGYAVSK